MPFLPAVARIARLSLVASGFRLRPGLALLVLSPSSLEMRIVEAACWKGVVHDGNVDTCWCLPV